MKNIQYLLIYMLLLFSSTLYAQGINEPEYFDEDFPKSNYSKRSEAEGLFEQGKLEYEDGNYTSALDYLKEAINLMPDHTMAYFYRAGAKEQINDLKGAITDYGIVIHFDPDFNEAYFNRGMLRYKVADFAGAIEDFNKLLSLPSYTTQAVYFKGTSYGSTGPGATSIISMYSKDADIYNYLGLSKTKLGDIRGAIKDFNKALAINSTDANIFVNRGLAHAADSNRESATKDFKHALALEPDHAVAMFNLGLSSEDKDQGTSIYDEIIAKNEDFPSAYINRALINFRAGNFPAALDDYNKALKLDPKNSIAYLNRALTYEKMEKFEEALKDLNKSINLDPFLYKAYSSRGNIYFKLQEYESALQDYNQVITAAENDASIFYNRALVKYKLKLKDEACIDLNYAIEQGYEAAQKALKAYCK